jgi:signal peptidase I
MRKANLKQIVDIICNIILIVFGLLATYVVLLVVVFDTFHTPTSSMTPTIAQNSHGVINKLKLGGRIFDIAAAANEEKFEIHRLPGYGHLQKNDIIIFNATFTDDWGKIVMNMRRYYCKRAVAVAGDTLEIKNGYYHVRGYDGVLGVKSEQDILSELATALRRPSANDSLTQPDWFATIPFDDNTGWTVADMGPLVIPAKGTTIRIDLLAYRLYKKYIEWETGETLMWCNNRAYCNGKQLTSYTFTENYCFAAGDHVTNSQDSRYWGLVPEKFIVGVKL